MNRRVAFARGLRRHMQSGIQDFFTRQGQTGFSAAKELGKETPEMRVDSLKGVAQQLPGFPINTADGALKGLHGFIQVGRLGLQKRGALASLVQFLQRGQVHRPQCRNGTGKTRHLLLQVRHFGWWIEPGPQARLINGDAKLSLRFVELRQYLVER